MQTGARRSRIAASIVLAALAYAEEARAIGPGEVYVRLTGTDGGECTDAAPCRSIAYGLGKLETVGGGMLHLGVGTFTQSDVNTNEPQGLCRRIPSHTAIVGEGGPTDKSLIQAYERDFVDAQGTSYASCGAFVAIAARDDIHFQNLIFDGNNQAFTPSPASCADASNLGSECGLISLTGGCTDVTFTDVEIRHSMMSAVYIRGTDEERDQSAEGIQFVRCFMHDSGDLQIGPFDHHIYANDVINFLVEDSVFTRSAGFGIQIQADHHHPPPGMEPAFASDIIIRRNLIVDNGKGAGGGVYLLNTTGQNLLENNVIARNGGDGLRMASGVSGWTIRHNTFHDNDAIGITPTQYPFHVVSAFGADASFVNNIFTGNDAVFYTPDATLRGDTNILVGEQVVAGGNLDMFTNTLTTPPAFVAADDLHLAPGSAGIDAAAPSETVDDLDRLLRPGGQANDLGAYELEGEPATGGAGGGGGASSASGGSPSGGSSSGDGAAGGGDGGDDDGGSCACSLSAPRNQTLPWVLTGLCAAAVLRRQRRRPAWSGEKQP